MVIAIVNREIVNGPSVPDLFDSTKLSRVFHRAVLKHDASGHLARENYYFHVHKIHNVLFCYPRASSPEIRTTPFHNG